jgi:hypothetical protein
MGWFSRTFRKVTRGVKKAAKATTKVVKGVKKAVKAVHSVVKKTGLTKILSHVIGKALSITLKVKGAVEGVIKKLPYGEEALLIAKIAVPQLAAFEALLANGQQLKEFVSSGKLNVKRLLVNSLKKRVPGWEKLEGTYGKFKETKELYEKLKAPTVEMVKQEFPVVTREFGKRAQQNVAEFFDDPDTLSTLKNIDTVKVANKILRKKPSRKSTGALKSALSKRLANEKKAAATEVQSRFRELLSRRR